MLKGENYIQLNEAAVRDLIEQELNRRIHSSAGRVKVNTIQFLPDVGSTKSKSRLCHEGRDLLGYVLTGN